MRGRTLSDAFVILDEAQNATADQLKMFLTRLGLGIEDGRQRRCDANRSAVGARSGLRDAAQRLGVIDDIGIVELDETDVVRHPLVAQDHPSVCKSTTAMTYAAAASIRGRSRASLRKLLAAVDHADAAISLTLVDDAAIREINREHRGKDQPTDVLSFRSSPRGSSPK